jgi:hypothetical protein
MVSSDDERRRMSRRTAFPETRSRMSKSLKSKRADMLRLRSEILKDFDVVLDVTIGRLNALQAARARLGSGVAVGQTIPRGKRKAVCMVLRERAGQWRTIGSGTTWAVALAEAFRLERDTSSEKA